LLGVRFFCCVPNVDLLPSSSIEFELETIMIGRLTVGARPQTCSMNYDRGVRISLHQLHVMIFGADGRYMFKAPLMLSRVL
jgi:hypothetical protein